MLDEMQSSFVKKNNSYSHCPLKKRPVTVIPAEETQPKTAIKEEILDVVDVQEPENLCTKPQDLSKSAPKRSRSPSPVAAVHYPVIKRSPSPISVKRSASPIAHHPQMPLTYQAQHPHYPTKAMTPPAVIAPIHPVAKKARVEVIQHESNSATAAPLHFMASSKSPLAIEPSLNLGSPVEPLPHYGSAAWPRAGPLYPHYLTYHHHHHYRYPSAEQLYPSYPVAAYPHSSPEHHSVSPSPPHPGLTCPTIQRPIARSFWPSPEHCGLSPTSSLGSASMRSPPPVSPEDLSSPGSDSGRSSAGSISAGSGIVKLEKSPGGAASNGSSNGSSASSPRYQCPDCAKSYSTYSGLSKHQQFHCAAAEGQAKKTFTCKYCEKVYLTLGALKMHIRTHTLPCKCHLCGKAFSRPWLLQGHIRTHTGEKPFSCQHCNRAFADRSNLRAHLQTHSDVKKYSCSSCSKTFSRMSLLTKHQEGGCPGVAVPIGYAC